MTSEYWKIRSADQKIDKSSGALDGHGDEGSGSYSFKLNQDAAYSSLSNEPKPFCDKIYHKIFSGKPGVTELLYRLSRCIFIHFITG